MNKPNPTSNTSQSPVKKRSARERVLVWGGILLLLLVVLAEWASRSSFDSTLSNIEEAIHASQGNGIALAAAQGQVRGVAFSGEETSNGQRKLTYRWPSLFKRYKLGLSVNESGRVHLVEVLSLPAETPVEAQAPVFVDPRPLPKQGLSAGAEQIVALKTNDLPESWVHPEVAGSLTREVIRQGLLLAARDELGLTTLDESLGEVVADLESPQTFPIDARVRIEFGQIDHNKRMVEIELKQPNRSAKWFSLFITPLAVNVNIADANWIEPLVEQVEKFARGEFVEALQKAGYQESSGRRDGVITDTADVAEHLDFVSQYTLLRRLHAQIRVNGEPPELLGRLVRAYANLGHLTDFHWTPMHKVFKARSLLYAQRLLAKEGATSVTLAHRAYARALTGLHRTALDDVQAARAAGQPAPDWLNLIDAYCAFKPEVLDQIEGPQKELALYLRMRMADPMNDKQDALLAIQGFLRLSPGCCRAAECLCEVPSLGVQRAVTESGFIQMWPDIYTRLAEIPNLPPAARAIAEQQRRSARGRNERDPQLEYAARVEFINQLQQVAATNKESGELSWTVLAELLRDVSFVQVWRVLNCETRWLGINADESLNELKPLVQGHRFEKFIDSFSSDHPAATASLKSLNDSLHPWWLEPATEPLVNAIYFKIGKDAFQNRTKVLRQNIDSIYEDLMRLPKSKLPDEFLTERLGRASPHWPLTMTWTFESNWDEAQQHAAQWEQTYANNPAVLLSLARKYRKLYRSADAERCFKKVIALIPSHAAHFELARLYRQQDKLKACEQILEDALKLPSYGLEDSQVRVQLAGLFMKQGAWEQAMPHAEAAAESYAGWALLTAARCAEGLEDWETAERYRRAESERYESDSSNWYFWCVRVGRGDVEQARALAERHWNNPDTRLSHSELWYRGVGQILAGDLQLARQSFETCFEEYENSYAAMLAALLADELGETEICESVYEKITTKERPGEELLDSRRLHDDLLEFINLLRNALRKGDQARWDHHDFDILTAFTDEGSKTFFYYVAGRFLEQHGQPERGRAYLECVATSYSVDSLQCLLANHHLRKQGVTVGKTRLNDLPDALAPSVELLQKSRLARAEGRLPEANDLLDQVIRLRPDFVPAVFAHGALKEFQEDYAAALADYREVLRIDPESVAAHNNLAWLLAACPQDDIRDGPQALKHAQRAFELRSVKTGTTYEALAAAHAECGDFAKAIEFQELAQPNVFDNDHVRKKMALYRKSQPYRRTTKPATQEQ